jgi:CHASE2 domain-containing sensor protein
MTKKQMIVAGAAVILLLLIAYFKPLRFIDNVIMDMNFIFAANEASDDVVVVGVDALSTKKYGVMPWRRSTMAALIDKINQGNPSVLALDFFFQHRPDEPGNDSLSSVFSRTKNLVLPFRIPEIQEAPNSNIDNDVLNEILRFSVLVYQNKELLPDRFFYNAVQIDSPDTMFTKYAVRSGFLNVSTSNTSQKLREAIQVVRFGKEYFTSFGIAAVAAYKNAGPDSVILDGKGRLFIADTKVPLTSYAASTVINFRSEEKPIKIISAADILDGKVAPSVFANKLVFAGVTDPFAGVDFFTTPVKSQTPGVIVWANIALDIMQKNWIRSQSIPLSLLNILMLLLIFPGASLLSLKVNRYILVASGFTVVIISLVLGLLLFSNGHYLWDASNHFYAFFFLVGWFALVKGSTTIISGGTHLQLEPSEDEIDDGTFVPPDKDDFLNTIPETDSANYVFRKLCGGNDFSQQDESTLNKTIVEGDNGLNSRTTLMTIDKMDIIKRFREIANGSILKLLGSGGMADVYLVWNHRLEVYRAVKVLKPDQSEAFHKRFETEIRIFAKLDHPNIVKCFSVGDWHELPYLEMEYIDGVSFEDILSKCKFIKPEQAIIIGILVCRALHYAHLQTINIYGTTYKGIIHRDLKPANIMLSKNGRIRLTDFGIARPENVSLHTGDTGNIVGTLPYLAPEQLSGKEPNLQVDIYALGATIYELIAGERAFNQGNSGILFTQKLAGNYTPLHKLAQVDKSISEIIDKSMALDLSVRFTSAKAFGDALEQALRQRYPDASYLSIANLVQRYWGN